MNINIEIFFLFYHKVYLTYKSDKINKNILLNKIILLDLYINQLNFFTKNK